MNNDVWDAIASTRADLAAPDFASELPGPSPANAQLAADQANDETQFDQHLAFATRSRPHDQRPLEDKMTPAAIGQGTNGGGGSSGPGTNPNGSGSGSGSGSGGSGNGGSGNGGSGNGGTGPPSWFKKWAQKHGSFGRGRERGRGALGGGGLLGAGALGGLPKLGNIPIGQAAAGTGTTSPSPIVFIVVIAAIGIGGYLLWHRLRVAHAQDKKLAEGKEPPADAAT